jgi:hypothetical protein
MKNGDLLNLHVYMSHSLYCDLQMVTLIQQQQQQQQQQQVTLHNNHCG